MFITVCCFLALATTVPQNSAPEPRRLDIEFLYLDLAECTRCVDTGTRLDEALTLLGPVLVETGWKATVKKIHVTSEDEARALRFSSSPTVRINGCDSQLESRESVCGDCGKLCKDSSVTCREWQFRGNWFTSPPKAIFVEAILKAMSSTPAEASSSGGPFELPDNLKRFFATKKAGTETRKSCCSSGESKSEHGRCCESKPSGDAAKGCCQGEEHGDSGSKAPACTLSAESRVARKRLLKETIDGAIERREIEQGISFRFKPEAEIVTRLARVIDLERDCCQSMTFQIRVEEKGGSVWLDVTGPASTKKVIDDCFGPK